MTLRRVLAPEPASASTARRFASDVLEQWREDAVADIVTLLVSELVTNAVLHAGTSVELTLRRRRQKLRIEVADQSPVAPGVRDYDTDAVTGRGLGLVGMLADDWGVQVRPDVGKVVWFEVAAAHRPVVLDDEEDSAWTLPPTRHGNVVNVRLLNTPVQLFEAMQQHTEALLREYTLIALQSDQHGRRAPRLDIDMSSALEQLRDATNTGRAHADLELATLAQARRTVGELREAFEDAENRAAEGQLLTAPALPEVAACRGWFLREVADQLHGAAPRPWVARTRESDARAPVAVDGQQVLDNLLEAVVVANDDNHIAHANPAAESLLGWGPGELTGQRLTAIIPPRLHDAHVAGYSRYLVTRTPRLIGQPVRVPARRRDGSEVEIELVINTFTGDNGRAMFVAALRPAARVDDEATTAVHAKSGDIVAAVLAALAPDDGDPADAVLAAVGSSLGWDLAAWWVVDGDVLRCSALWERTPGRHDAFKAATTGRRFERGTGVPGRVWAADRPVWVSDVVADANFPRVAVAVRDGLRTACGFPVVTSGGHLVAVAEVYTETMLPEDASVLEALGTVGRIVGWALSR